MYDEVSRKHKVLCFIQTFKVHILFFTLILRWTINDSVFYISTAPKNRRNRTQTKFCAFCHRQLLKSRRLNCGKNDKMKQIRNKADVIGIVSNYPKWRLSSSGFVDPLLEASSV